MSRQILFRGKALIGGEWIYGGYTYDDSDKDHMITQVNEDGLVVGYAVDPATVGQFTGLTDSKGNKVFEGDVLIYIATSMSSMEVKFENGCFVGEGPFNTHPLSIYLNSGDFESIEVSGNIHDNPELI